MAPTGSRRPGHSRRAQYGTFLNYLLAVAGAAAGGALLIAASSDATVFSGIRGTATDLAAPAGEAGAGARTESQGLLRALGAFFTKGSRVAKLEREVAEARVRLVEAQALHEENRELRALLKLAQSQPKPVASARLIGSTASSTRRFALLGVGSSQGVGPGMPVISPLGLIGRVLEVGRSSARVLLITDSQSIIPVRRASDGIVALAVGNPDGTVHLKLQSLALNPLKAGDAFVTSGSGGLFRPGIPFAVVAKPTRDGAIARPLSNPASTDFVIVEPQWDEAGGDPTLPAPAGAQ